VAPSVCFFFFFFFFERHNPLYNRVSHICHAALIRSGRTRSDCVAGIQCRTVNNVNVKESSVSCRGERYTTLQHRRQHPQDYEPGHQTHGALHLRSSATLLARGLCLRRYEPVARRGHNPRRHVPQRPFRQHVRLVGQPEQRGNGRPVKLEEVQLGSKGCVHEDLPREEQLGEVVVLDEVGCRRHGAWTCW